MESMWKATVKVYT